LFKCLSQAINCEKNVCFLLIYKLRRAMVRPGRDKLSDFVEVDETNVGGKKPGKRGRVAE
jgi:hypothetical protein